MTAQMPLKLALAGALSPAIRLSGAFGQRWEQFWSYARMRAMFPALDPSVVLLGMPEVHGTRRIAFGRGLYLYKGLHLETQDDGQIDLGDEVVMSRGVHLVAFKSIRIGHGSLIGEYTSVRDAAHRFGPGVEPRHSGHESRAILIGSHVWIGRGVTILPGVTIGDGAVIGANAVVTQNVEANQLVAGVPARPICRGARS